MTKFCPSIMVFSFLLFNIPSEIKIAKDSRLLNQRKQLLKDHEK